MSNVSLVLENILANKFDKYLRLEANELIFNKPCEINIDYGTHWETIEDEELTFKGTANVKTKSTPVILLSDDTIPLNTTNNYIEVLMRFYFDGALMNGENAYINSNEINADTVEISITFTAEE